MGSSKKYKNKLCVYCRESMSTTADHVFPREIFQKEQRSNHPKVPACEECNNEKSQLEHYLLSVLPFGATHSNAKKALSIDVKKRLGKNRKLHNEIKKGFCHTYIPVRENELERRSTINFDVDALNEFVGYIGRGLMWHHWNRYLPLESGFITFVPSPTGQEYISKLFDMSSSLRINALLGDDTVRYKGVMSETDEGVSVWAVQLLGGITVSDENQGHIFSNSFVAMITGSPTMLEKLNLQGAT